MPTPLGYARGWLNAGLSYLYPEVCQVCKEHRARPAEGYVCGTCQQDVVLVTPPWCEICGRSFAGEITETFVCSQCRQEQFAFAWARSAALAKERLLQIIHGFKYNEALWFEPFLGNLLAHRAAPSLSAGGWDVIVPVPLYPTKERERGFNQSALLANHLSKATGIPVLTKAVRRVAHTRTQTRLSRSERRKNVENAFAPAGSSVLDGASVVLIDDVFTTGATTDACARALLLGGAKMVCVWTVARGV